MTLGLFPQAQKFSRGKNFRESVQTREKCENLHPAKLTGYTVFLAAIFGRLSGSLYVTSSTHAPALPVNNFISPKSLSMSTTTNGYMVYHLSHPVSISIVS